MCGVAAPATRVFRLSNTPHAIHHLRREKKANISFCIPSFRTRNPSIILRLIKNASKALLNAVDASQKPYSPILDACAMCIVCDVCVQLCIRNSFFIACFFLHCLHSVRALRPSTSTYRTGNMAWHRLDV